MKQYSFPIILFGILNLMLFSACITIKIGEDGSSLQKTELALFDAKNITSIHEYKAAEDIEFQIINADDLSGLDLSNEITWIYLMPSYCKPCIEKLPSLIKLDKDYPELKMIIVSEGYSVERLQKLLFENNYNGTPYILDASKYGTKTGDKSELFKKEFWPNHEYDPGFPQNYISSKDGMLQDYFGGTIDEKVLYKIIEKQESGKG